MQSRVRKQVKSRLNFSEPVQMREFGILSDSIDDSCKRIVSMMGNAKHEQRSKERRLIWMKCVSEVLEMSDEILKLGISISRDTDIGNGDVIPHE